jgi:CubicO group peptidase (beta-lactamase class C family)
MINPDRRLLLALMGAGLVAPRAVFAASSAPGIAQRLAEAEQGGRVVGLHALLVSQRGELVFEHYGQGEDEKRGGPLGHVVFGPDVLHDLRSVSKSVVALAYGIALKDGKVPPPDAKLYEQFPDYADLGKEPGRDRITIHHALSMTLGFEWDELTIPYGDPRNNETAMEMGGDRFRYILSRKIVAEPGARWTYCSGATDLLGKLIAKGTGEALPAYCRRVLFDPVGLGPSEWSIGEDGEPRAASGLRLRPRDLIKLGQLVLADGAWNGRPIVPADWVKRATTPVVAINDGRLYGYQWYMGEFVGGTPSQPMHWTGGFGWGGQYLLLFPAQGLVIVAHCGNYGKPGREQRAMFRALLGDVVLPGLA